MSACRVPSYHPPASSMQTFAPAAVSTCAAQPPLAPEPIMMTSYVWGVAFTCAIPTILRCNTAWRAGNPAADGLGSIHGTPLRFFRQGRFHLMQDHDLEHRPVAHPVLILRRRIAPHQLPAMFQLQRTAVQQINERAAALLQAQDPAQWVVISPLTCLHNTGGSFWRAWQ